MNSINQGSSQATSRDRHSDTGKVTIEPYGSNGVTRHQVYVRRPQSGEEAAGGPLKIGGVLKLLGFALILATLLTIGSFIGSPDILEGLDLGLLTWLCYAFFTKRRTFPKWIIGCMVYWFLINMVYLMSPDAHLPAATRFIFMVRTIGPPVIWIPYLLKSERVKNTFVN